METEERKSAGSLATEPPDERLSSYTLLGLLRRLESADPEKPRLGAARRPALDIARVEQSAHVIFAPTEIAEVDSESSPPLVRQYGLGVMGPNGALPLHLTEWIHERSHSDGDRALEDLVNAVQRRLLSLFYRAWSAVDPAANFDRPDDDEFRLFMGALVGLADPSTRGKRVVDDRALLGRSGLFGLGSRPADALESIIESHFDVKAQVIPYSVEWLGIPGELWTRLGVIGDGATLGRGATLGSSSWQCQFAFELRLGPLTRDQFRSFIPGGTALEPLKDLVGRFTGDEWSWRVRLVLMEGEVPRAQLGTPRNPSDCANLGWNTWLGRATRAAQDVVLRGANPGVN